MQYFKKNISMRLWISVLVVKKCGEPSLILMSIIKNRNNSDKFI